MKKNTKIKISLLALSLAVAASFGCSDNGLKSQDNPAILQFLIGQQGLSNEANQRKCVFAYGLANSCVGGTQFFNSGVGCTSPAVKDEATYDALISCINKAINDPVQPCNVTQFKYAFASQALAGAFASCNGDFKFTPSGGTETSYALKDVLKY
jgi:hypothetical protein